MITYNQALNGLFNRSCPEVCLEAVKQSGCAFKYIKKQTKEVCLEAVKQNGYALQYVKVEEAPVSC